MNEKKIRRKCLVCGKTILVKAKESGAYKGGHFFGKMKLPVGKGKYKVIGKTQILGKPHNVVKWTGKQKEFEYWECKKCFGED